MIGISACGSRGHVFRRVMPALSVRPTGSLRRRKPMGPHRTARAFRRRDRSRAEQLKIAPTRADRALLQCLEPSLYIGRHICGVALRPTGFFRAENFFRPVRKTSSRVYQHLSQHIFDPKSRKRGQKFIAPVIARTTNDCSILPLGADHSEQFRCFAAVRASGPAEIESKMRRSRRCSEPEYC